MQTDLSSCSDVLAKESKSLVQHSKEAVYVLKRFVAFHKLRLERLAIRLGIPYEELVARLFVTVSLHDIGKSSSDFQNHLDKAIKGVPHAIGVPHALLSLPFVLAVPPLTIAGGREYRPEAVAVMSHHTPFYDKLYRKYTTDPLSAKYLRKCADAMFESIPNWYKEEFGSDFPLALQKPNLSCSAPSIIGLITANVNYYPPTIIREIHSTFEATLHYCDWLASGEQFDFKFSLSGVRENIQDSMRDKQLYSFQEACANTTNNLLLSAPTGKGKTEASLLWAANQQDCRILYLLPTRVSSNAMYDRLNGIFPSLVGVSHGTSALTVGEQESWVKEKVSLEILRSSAFMKPVTVATVDQLLFSLFNWRHWEMIVESAKSSSIILDEIHAYDAFTLSLILIMCEEMREYGPRWSFVSATLPMYLNQVLKKFLGNNSARVSDREFLTEERHNVRFLKTNIESVVPEILNEFHANKSVLIILNTVSEAKKIHETLSKSKTIPSSKLVLYHSRFIEKDRRKKEIAIATGESKRGFVAVATQVVEVSLDIDYTVLFTQVAPLDDLAQRLGRVNRKGKKPIRTPNVFICNPGEYDHLIYGKENLRVATELIESYLDGGNVNQQVLIRLIEQQYPKEDKIKEVNEEFERTKENLLELRENLWQIQSLRLQDRSKDLYRFAKTRDQTLMEIEAIPIQFKDEIAHLDNKLKSLAYYVKLPLPSYAESLSSDDSLNGMLFANIEYSPMTGIGSSSSGAVIL